MAHRVAYRAKDSFEYNQEDNPAKEGDLLVFRDHFVFVQGFQVSYLHC